MKNCDVPYLMKIKITTPNWMRKKMMPPPLPAPPQTALSGVSGGGAAPHFFILIATPPELLSLARHFPETPDLEADLIPAER